MGMYQKRSPRRTRRQFFAALVAIRTRKSSHTFANLRTTSCMSIIRSACDVQDGVRVTRVLFQFFDCFNRRQDQELDLAAIGFSLHFLPDRQGAASGADHQAPAFPRYLLFERERRVAELLAEFLGRLLIVLAHLSDRKSTRLNSSHA